MDEKKQTEAPRYRWPWFVLGMVVLAFVLAVIWMSVLVHRIREQREFNMWTTPTRSVPPTNSTHATTNLVAPPRTH